MAELLSDLCSICHDNKSKYRCPGCSSRTCSLPCYKRHQQWAQCSGKRDPTKYVKKSQLATPAGIDHDYNFIAGIERKLDQAERDAEEKTLNTANESRKSGQQKSKLTQHRLAQSGVTVEEAPVGISRQKTNTSHLTNRKQIIWTVEWIHEDKTRDLNEVPEGYSISRAYQQLFNSKRGISSRKRKRQQKEQTAPDKPLLKDSSNAATVETQAIQVEKRAESGGGEDAAAGSVSPRPGASEEDSTSKSVRRPGLNVDEPDPEPILSVNVAESIDAESPNALNFYLHKPRTTTTKTVLIPLPLDATLADCLRNRTVLEYPTLYVLSSAPDVLPDDYQLEADYLEQSGHEQKELEVLLSSHPEGMQALDEGDQVQTMQDQLDDRKILEVLKQDVASRS